MPINSNAAYRRRPWKWKFYEVLVTIYLFVHDSGKLQRLVKCTKMIVIYSVFYTKNKIKNKKAEKTEKRTRFN